MTAVGQRWAPICQECWELVEPDQYFPVETDYTECAACGQTALIVNVHPEVVRIAAGRPCYCLSLFRDHRVGATGCQYNPDWTERWDIPEGELRAMDGNR